LLAVPLGIRSKSSKKSFGIGLGIVFFLIYYLLLSTGWVFGEAGTYPPLIGMWVPNIVMGGIGLILIVNAANERYMRFDRFSGMMANLKKKNEPK
jgi:lipopolysaccharide export system permease protein